MKIRIGLMAACVLCMMLPIPQARADAGIILGPIVSELVGGLFRDMREGRYDTRRPAERRRVIEGRVVKHIHHGPTAKQLAKMIDLAMEQAIANGVFDEYIESTVNRKVAEAIQKEQKRLAEAEKAKQPPVVTVVPRLPKKGPADEGPPAKGAEKTPTPGATQQPPRLDDPHLQHAIIRKNDPAPLWRPLSSTSGRAEKLFEDVPPTAEEAVNTQKIRIAD